MIRYRTETFSGLGERIAENVLAYETFEMGNTDILETLIGSLLKTNDELVNKCFSYISELSKNGFVDDFSFDEGVGFFKEVLKEIKNLTGYEIKYVLWLADKNVVSNRNFYGRYLDDENDIDAYRIGPVVLSDLGYDGTLYGYEEYPEPIDNIRSTTHHLTRSD